MKFLRITILSLFVLMIIYLTIINLYGLRDSIFNYWCEIYLLIPLFGGLFGLIRFSKKHKFSKVNRIAGKSFSIGLILWATGNIYWMFEVLVLKTQIPFPSLADLFYLLHGVFWMAGTFIILRKEEENILPSLSQIAPYIILLSINSYVLIFKDVKLADILNSTKSAEFLSSD